MVLVPADPLTLDHIGRGVQSLHLQLHFILTGRILVSEFAKMLQGFMKGLASSRKQNLLARVPEVSSQARQDLLQSLQQLSVKHMANHEAC